MSDDLVKQLDEIAEDYENGCKRSGAEVSNAIRSAIACIAQLEAERDAAPEARPRQRLVLGVHAGGVPCLLGRRGVRHYRGGDVTRFEPFALTAKNAAKRLDMSEREFLALVEQGALPGPSWYGRWNAEELRRIVSGEAAKYGRLEL